MKRSTISLAVFAAFVVTAVGFNWHPQVLEIDGTIGIVKLLLWLLFVSFAAYSVHCSRHENLFRTIRTMNGLYWGRQIGIDLYIGLLLFSAFVFVHESSMIAVALWVIPIILFANLATLLYLAIHLESIVAMFTN